MGGCVEFYVICGIYLHCPEFRVYLPSEIIVLSHPAQAFLRDGVQAWSSRTVQTIRDKHHGPTCIIKKGSKPCFLPGSEMDSLLSMDLELGDLKA